MYSPTRQNGLTILPVSKMSISGITHLIQSVHFSAFDQGTAGAPCLPREDQPGFRMAVRVLTDEGMILL